MPAFRIIIVTLISCLFGFSISVEAARFDSRFLELQRKHADKWAMDQTGVNPANLGHVWRQPKVDQRS